MRIKKTINLKSFSSYFLKNDFGKTVYYNVSPIPSGAIDWSSTVTEITAVLRVSNRLTTDRDWNHGDTEGGPSIGHRLWLKSRRFWGWAIDWPPNRDWNHGDTEDGSSIYHRSIYHYRIQHISPIINLNYDNIDKILLIILS